MVSKFASLGGPPLPTPIGVLVGVTSGGSEPKTLLGCAHSKMGPKEDTKWLRNPQNFANCSSIVTDDEHETK